MSPPYAVVFGLLVAIPGVLIPTYVISQMRVTLADGHRTRTDKRIARATIAAMAGLIVFSIYAALAVYSSLNAIENLVARAGKLAA